MSAAQRAGESLVIPQGQDVAGTLAVITRGPAPGPELQHARPPSQSQALRPRGLASPRMLWWARMAVALAVLAACAVMVVRTDWHRVHDTLAVARLSFFAVSLLLGALLIFLRAERWRLLLPGATVPRRPLFFYLFVAFGLTMVTPVGAPETMRVYLLRRRHDVPVPVGTAGILLEKLFEGVGMIPLVAALPFLLPLPAAMNVLIVGLTTGGVIVTAAVVWLAHASHHSTWLVFGSSLWQRITPGLDCLRDRRTFAKLCVTSLAAHSVDCVCAWLVLRSLAIDVPAATSALLLLTLSVAVVVPVVPGHVGMLEAGAIAALRMVGVPNEPALAFALLYHVGQMVYVLCALPGITLLRGAQAEQRGDASGALALR